MIDIRPVSAVLGLLLAILGTMMLLPALADIAVGHDDWGMFVASAGVTVFAGSCLWLTGRTETIAKLTIRQTFLLTGLAWVVLAGFGALPFMWGPPALSFTDAYFESMSGLTTTGATVISGLDTMPPGILLWRSLLHWYGGIGIIVAAIAVLPALQIGGMQLFRTESSDKSEKVLPRAAEIAKGLLVAYAILTVIATFAYWFAGMTLFDAVNHAMSALSTGGMSTRDASISAWASPAIDYVTIAVMIAGALPMVLYVRALGGDFRRFVTNPEVRLFLLVIILFTLAMTFVQRIEGIATGEPAVRAALFTVVSLITTTGFMAVDYTNWGALSDTILFMVLFLGGCTGSTSGGLKAFRLGILASALGQQIKRVIYPSGVFPIRYGGAKVGDDVVAAVFAFVFVYVAAFAVIGTGLNLLGLDLRTALSATIACLANVGPGLGPVVGPASNYIALGDAAIWLLSLAMLLGRLEFFTILILLLPRFWRG